MSFLPTHSLRLLLSLILVFAIIPVESSFAFNALTGSHKSYSGKVSKVISGDTFEVKKSNTTAVVRLAGVDAPEIGQKGAGAAWTFLKEKLLGEYISVRVIGLDCKRREVAKVYLNSRDMSELMISQGLAWVSGEHGNDFALYQLQGNARANKIGLWSNPSPVPPWDWRKDPKKGSGEDC